MSNLMPTVLIIDDNAAVAMALDVLFSLHDIAALRAASPEEGLALLAKESVDLVIQDMNFTADTTSGAEGVALFRAIRRLYPDLPVILLTAWTHLDVAVDLVKAGAADYLSKPWDDQRLLATVANLVELGQANRTLTHAAQRERRARRELEEQFDLRGLVWRDPATERVLSLACQVARADVPVLITGPNGTGKERIAEIIQANSQVASGPFVVLNCGALPADLIEAELFGADAGAYTGAARAPRRQIRRGRWRHAVPRRNRQPAAGRADEAAARARNRALRTARIEPRAAGQRARDQRDERRPGRNDPCRHLPRRPVLPPECDRATAAATGCASGRHPAAGAQLFERRPSTRRACRGQRCWRTRGRAMCAS